MGFFRGAALAAAVALGAGQAGAAVVHVAEGYGHIGPTLEGLDVIGAWLTGYNGTFNRVNITVSADTKSGPYGFNMTDEDITLLGQVYLWLTIPNIAGVSTSLSASEWVSVTAGAGGGFNYDYETEFEVHATKSFSITDPAALSFFRDEEIYVMPGYDSYGAFWQPKHPGILNEAGPHIIPPMVNFYIRAEYVSQVPLPAGVALLPLGIGALAAIRPAA